MPLAGSRIGEGGEILEGRDRDVAAPGVNSSVAELEESCNGPGQQRVAGDEGVHREAAMPVRPGDSGSELAEALSHGAFSRALRRRRVIGRPRL